MTEHAYMESGSGNFAFQHFIEMLIDGEDEHKTLKQIAEEVGVSDRTLLTWKKKKVDWEYVKTERRKKYASDMLDIDRAMVKEAKKGDVAAAKLAYERFDGWIPASQSFQSVTHDIDESIIDDELKALMGKKQDTFNALANTVDDARRGQITGTGSPEGLQKAE